MPYLWKKIRRSSTMEKRKYKQISGKRPDCSLPKHYIRPSSSDSSLKVLYDCENATLDVCFIHGPDGNPGSAWTASGQSAPWPGILLPPKLSSARVLAYDFEEYQTTEDVASTPDGLQQVAMGLLRSLVSDRAQFHASHRPIIFVAHSLGGFICKKALLLSQSLPHLDEIWYDTRGIIFMGTPHGEITELAIRSSPASAVIKPMLETFGARLQDLQSVQDEFLSMIQARQKDKAKLEIMCFFELLPTDGRNTVISQKQATLGGYDSTGLQATHMNMTRFATSEDDGFKLLVEKLLQWTCSRNTGHQEAPRPRAVTSSTKSYRPMSSDYASHRFQRANRISSPNLPPLSCSRKRSRSFESWDPFSWAAENGDKTVISMFLKTGKVNINTKSGKYDRTALLTAAYFGQEEIVEVLLGHKDIEVDAKDLLGYTPLIAAARNGHESVVRSLLNVGKANSTIADNEGKTALLWASHGGYATAAELLLDKPKDHVLARDVFGQTPFSAAAMGGHENILKLLLGTNEGEIDLKDNAGRTPLSLAAEHGHYSVTNLLLRTGKVDVNSTDIFDKTPLIFASENGHHDILGLLLDTGTADIDKRDRLGHTPLLWATKNGHETVVRSLLSTDAVNVNAKNPAGYNPLLLAAKNGCCSIVKLLLDTNKVDMSSTDEHGRSPLWWAQTNGHDIIVKLLQSTGKILPLEQDSGNGSASISPSKKRLHKSVSKSKFSVGAVDERSYRTDARMNSPFKDHRHGTNSSTSADQQARFPLAKPRQSIHRQIENSTSIAGNVLLQKVEQLKSRIPENQKELSQGQYAAVLDNLQQVSFDLRQLQSEIDNGKPATTRNTGIKLEQQSSLLQRVLSVTKLMRRPHEMGTDQTRDQILEQITGITLEYLDMLMGSVKIAEDLDKSLAIAHKASGTGESRALGATTHTPNEKQVLESRPGEVKYSVRPFNPCRHSTHFDARHEYFRGRRLSDTCKWFHSTVEFQNWFFGDKNDALWCWGINGCGKSTIVSSVIDMLELTGHIHAYYYFSEEKRQSATRLVASLLEQLQAQIDCLDSSPSDIKPTAVPGTYESHEKSLASKQESFHVLLEEMTKICSKTTQGVFVVLDAWRESNMKDADEFHEVLEHLRSAHCKILITSRTSDVQNIFCDHVDIGIDLKHNISDLCQYVEQNILEWAESGHGERGAMNRLEISRVVDIIASSSYGSFYYAHMLVQIFKGVYSPSDSMNMHFLQKLFHLDRPMYIISEMLEIFERNESFWPAKATLFWLSISPCGVPMQSLQSALPLISANFSNASDETFGEDFDIVLDQLTGIAAVDPGTATLQIASDDIRSAILERWGNPSQDLIFNIFRLCVESLGTIDAHSLRTEALMESFLKSNPFLVYATQTWAFYRRKLLDLSHNSAHSPKNVPLVSDLTQRQPHVGQMSIVPVEDSPEESVIGSVDNYTDRVAILTRALFENENVRAILAVSLYLDGDSEEGHVDYQSIRSWVCSMSRVHIAARLGMNDLVLETLINDPSGCQKQDDKGRTPLHEAARAGFLDVVKTLLSAGAEVDAPNHSNNTPLHYAKHSGNHRLFVLMFEHFCRKYCPGEVSGAVDEVAKHIDDYAACICPDSTTRHIRRKKELAMINAIRQGQVGVCRFLVEKCSLSMDCRDDNGVPALHVAINTQQLELVRLALAAGASPSAVGGEKNESALHLAARLGNCDMVVLLMSKNASMRHVDNDDRTILMAAVECQSDESAEKIMLKFLRYFYLDEIEILVKRDRFGRGVMHVAAMKGMTKLLQMYIDPGFYVKLTAPDNKGKRPLDYAQEHGHGEAACVLKDWDDSRERLR